MSLPGPPVVYVEGLVGGLLDASWCKGGRQSNPPDPKLRPFVNNRLRERILAREEGSPSRHIGALTLVSGPVSQVAGRPYVLIGLAVFLVLVVGLVVFPAVWSSKPARRKAALAVLDRLLRWKG